MKRRRSMFWPVVLLAVSAAVPAIGAQMEEDQYPQGEKIVLPGPRTPVKIELPDGVPTDSVHYKSMAASTMNSTYSVLGFAYGGAGCMYRTGGGGSAGDFDMEFTLPDGAVIVLARYEFYDTNATQNTDAALLSFDAAGNFNTIVPFLELSSSGTPGYSVAQVPLSYVVDQGNETLAMRVNLGEGTNSTVRACRIILGYVLEGSDHIFVDGFEFGDTSAWDLTTP